MPFWIRKANQIGLTWTDMNKLRSEKVAGSGGLMVSLGIVIGIFLFIAIEVFYFDSSEYLINILALVCSLLLLSGIGLVDDLLGWQRGGLSKKSRILLVIVAAIPLVTINAGKSITSLPFFGAVDLGIIYPLVLIPLGILGAATTFNFLAGFNGLEAGQGILLLGGSALVAYLTGSSYLAVIALCACAALTAFMVFNFYPAKVFPGDSLTYTIGGLLAILAILGNFERIALFFFIPIIIEVFLKSRGRLVKQSFGKPKSDGSLGLKYDKIYGLTHLSIFLLAKFNIKPTERRVVFSLWMFQLVIILIGFIIFRKGIF